MLEITNLNKVYQLKDQKVEALKNITMRFRRSEFVSILGPSGCGKTTLLNVIGGLDRYTSGDLIIDGVSTKCFKDKDWDNYRNHRVGFVFQSYNLIPHQTILENVELALTLSGVKRAERKKRAIEVLGKVGLADKLKSKPNQLSGGQMQRVAIARALVNDPEIILADEPTGALDSKTSVQIMDLLKEVSKDRLVIMVTHNPELAQKYSSRIIRLLDGELKEDSKPYTEKACKKEVEAHKAKLQEENTQTETKTFKKTKNKKSMSFFTALFLSLKNLLTKKGRTIMVSFAGSIGIIGIALILAVSSGMTTYINRMQSESLSSYPVSISYMALDMDAATSAVMGGGGSESSEEKNDDSIAVNNPTASLMGLGWYNYISPDFVDYVNNYYKDEHKRELINDYQVSFANDMRLITHNPNYTVSMGNTTINMPYVPVNSKVSTSALTGTTSSTFFQELDSKYVLSMYDMVGGKDAYYPTKANEVALVLNSDSVAISTLATIGITSDFSLKEVKYDQILGRTYRLLYNDVYYNTDTLTPNIDFDLLSGEESSKTAFMTSYLPQAETLYNAAGVEGMGKDLKITCVLKLKDDAAGSIFSDGLMYTSKLAEEYHENCVNSTVVNKIKELYLTTDENDNIILSDYAQNNFAIKYTVNIDELETYFSKYTQYFIYENVEAMQVALAMYHLTLSDEQLIDLYCQVYGGSSVPTGVYFYASTFDAKDDVQAMIDKYNETATFKLLYTDSSQFLTTMLKSLVDIISYVLIAFAAISLIVSSIMIGIITYTSVIERTKEIGVLRSVGASKRDVFRVFTAETVIIGLTAGVIGIAVAGVLSIFVGMLLANLTGVAGLAVLQPLACIVLVVISTILTFIAGLIPSRIATKKDPVLALRSE